MTLRPEDQAIVDRLKYSRPLSKKTIEDVVAAFHAAAERENQVKVDNDNLARQLSELDDELAALRAKMANDCRDLTKSDNIDQFRLSGDDGKAFMHGYIDACNDCAVLIAGNTEAEK